MSPNISTLFNTLNLLHNTGARNQELKDNKIKDLQIKKAELVEKLQECDNEDYAINIGKKLKDVLNLKELTPQVLHFLVEKITCKNDGTVHIQYSFVNPLQET